MGLKEYFRKIVLICYQNEDEDGPIASSLTAMSTRDSSGNPVSLIGSDVANLIKARGVWVLFFPTGGDGVAQVLGQLLRQGGSAVQDGLHLSGEGVGQNLSP